MKRIGSLNVAGETVFVEVDDDSTGATATDVPLPVFRGGHAASQDSSESDMFTQALGRIRPVAERVVQTFRHLNEPDQIEVEFGIKFSTKVGAFLASADSEAAFRICLSWKKPSPDGRQRGTS